jgi:acetyl esterase/lipase
MSPDELCAIGVTAAQFVDFHRRPADPPGAVFESHALGASGRLVHVYRRADSNERRPVVLLLHGGAWMEHTPFMLIRYAHLFAEHGWVAACPDYRYSSQAIWPAQLDDVMAACRWVQEHAHELGADARRFGLFGNSAGGHLATFAAQELGRVARAIVLLYPVTDVRPTATPLIVDACRALVGSADEAAYASASPIDHVRPGTATVLTMTGSEDTLTPLASIEAYHAALTAAGVPNVLTVLPGRGHAFDLLPTEWDVPSRLAVDFLRQHLPPVP